MELYNVKHALFTTGTCTFGKSVAKFVTNKRNEKSLGSNETRDDDIDGNYRMGYFYNHEIRPKPSTNSQTLIEHKCTGCGSDQNWNEGNYYNEMFEGKKYYCQLS
jgi:hypothetical protein